VGILILKDIFHCKLLFKLKNTEQNAWRAKALPAKRFGIIKIKA
jgi:hypothetical protein